jgi:hypothetical protein
MCFLFNKKKQAIKLVFHFLKISYDRAKERPKEQRKLQQQQQEIKQQQNQNS